MVKESGNEDQMLPEGTGPLGWRHCPLLSQPHPSPQLTFVLCTQFMTVPRTPQITIQEKTDEINTSHQVPEGKQQTARVPCTVSFIFKFS